MKSASRRGSDGAAEADELVDVGEVTTQEAIGGRVDSRAAGGAASGQPLTTSGVAQDSQVAAPPDFNRTG